MKNVLRGAAVVAAIVTSSLVVTPAAFAASYDGECTSGESCVFYHSNYGGGMIDFGSNDNSWVNNHYTSGLSTHDSASSGFGIDRAFVYWVDVSYSGPYFVLGVNRYDALWTTNQPNASGGASYNYNDKIDSHALYVP